MGMLRILEQYSQTKITLFYSTSTYSTIYFNIRLVSVFPCAMTLLTPDDSMPRTMSLTVLET